VLCGTTHMRGAVVTPRHETQSILDTAPTENGVTDYDRQHLVTYLRLLDAAAAGVDTEQIIREVLKIDPMFDPERARRAYDTHLARARWMSREGYRYLATDETLKRN
jgi:type VI secretion system activator RovC-like protein